MEENNLIFLCKECTDERKKNFQEKFNKYSLKIGDFIKAEFFEKNSPSEHMWVEVVSLTESGINGRLDNEPYFLRKLKLNDSVFVKYSDIEDKFALSTEKVQEDEE